MVLCFPLIITDVGIKRKCNVAKKMEKEKKLEKICGLAKG
jgi:hypothetical protein